MANESGRPLSPAQQQFGNQNAKGCTTSGRPRTSSLPPDDMIALGEEMLDWIEENDPVHLSQFYCIHKRFTEKQWDAMVRIPEFIVYYETALKTIGLKYILKETEIEPSVKQRWLRHYYRDLRQLEDETTKYNESVKAAQVQTGDTYVVYTGDSAAYTDGQVPSKTLPAQDPQCSK